MPDKPLDRERPYLSVQQPIMIDKSAKNELGCDQERDRCHHADARHREADRANDDQSADAGEDDIPGQGVKGGEIAPAHEEHDHGNDDTADGIGDENALQCAHPFVHDAVELGLDDGCQAAENSDDDNDQGV